MQFIMDAIVLNKLCPDISVHKFWPNRVIDGLCPDPAIHVILLNYGLISKFKNNKSHLTNFSLNKTTSNSGKKSFVMLAHVCPDGTTPKIAACGETRQSKEKLFICSIDAVLAHCLGSAPPGRCVSTHREACAPRNVVVKKSFSSPYNLTRHEIIHTRSKRFFCTIDKCNKSFAKKGTLKNHIKVHKGILFSCNVSGCNKQFAYKNNLNRHKRKFHFCVDSHYIQRF
jgi:hypothetical protein